MVRFIAGDADLARVVEEERDDAVPVAFFADFLAALLADVFVAFAVAAFARFDFA